MSKELLNYANILRNIEGSEDDEIIINDSYIYIYIYIYADGKIFVYIFRTQKTKIVLQCLRLRYGDSQWPKFKANIY